MSGKATYSGSANWNPWHGCHKISDGCKHCYVYRMDARHNKQADRVERTQDFYLPIRHARDGSYKIKPGTLIWTCFTSDFLVEDADEWRSEAWRMMKTRSDCRFSFITKRIDRLEKCLPTDWGSGYPNVTIMCTVENQKMADYRLPIYLAAPIAHKAIACEPLLTDIDLSAYLSPQIRRVVVGGESGPGARVCQYEWVLHLRRQCIDANVGFWFKQTGANFIKDGKQYSIPRRLQHAQAHKANINIGPSLIGTKSDI